MMNDEIKAAVKTINGMEEAYQLACANGYAGGRKDFMELCIKAAEETSGAAMDLDDMAQVAGGGEGSVVDDVINWCKENPAAVAAVGVATAATVAAVSYGVYAYKHRSIEDPNVPRSAKVDLPLPADKTVESVEWGFWHPVKKSWVPMTEN